MSTGGNQAGMGAVIRPLTLITCGVHKGTHYNQTDCINVKGTTK